MRLAWLCTCLWPGLSRLWIAGQWSGLFVAVAFSALLNLLLAATFVWPEWLDPNVQAALFLATVGFWIVSAYSSLRWVRSDAACQFGNPSLAELSVDSTEDAEDSTVNSAEDGSSDPSAASPQRAKSFGATKLLSAAQAEYLKGHWFEAEASLKKILARNPRDIEARLLWVGVLRRSKRADAAKRQLKILSRLEGADGWALEIRDERRRVAQLLKVEKAQQFEAIESPATKNSSTKNSSTENSSMELDPSEPNVDASQTADSRRKPEANQQSNQQSNQQANSAASPPPLTLTADDASLSDAA